VNIHPSKLPTLNLPDECLDGAECLFDPELHDGPDPEMRLEHADARTAREDVAKDICATCPVQTACLEYAIRTKPVRGVWAGMTADEISNLAARRVERGQLGDLYQGVA
jgi:WhiB family transcriptional regulator, redox-sensing transcriptional regulator